MKAINAVILVAITFCNTGLALADSFSGIAREYDIYNKGKPTKYKEKNVDINQRLPKFFYSGDSKIAFEKNTVTDIKNYLGGSIKKDDSNTWVCYNSKSEGITYWFISFTEMQHGYLSTIILSPLDKKAKCDIPLHTVNLKPNVEIPLLSSSRKQAFNRFGLTIDKKIPSLVACNSIKVSDPKFKEPGDQLNCVQYFFKKDKTIGVFISQVSTN